MDPNRSVRFRNNNDNPMIWKGLRTIGRGVCNLMPLWGEHHQTSDGEMSSRTYLIEDSRTESDTSTPFNRTFTKRKKKVLKKRTKSHNASIGHESDTENDIDSNFDSNDNNEYDKLIKKSRKKRKLNTIKNNFWYKIKKFFNFFKLLNFKKKKSNEKLIQSSESNEGMDASYDSPYTSIYSQNGETSNLNNEIKDEENYQVTTLYSTNKYDPSSSQEDDLNSGEEIKNIFKNSKLEFTK